jgi:hypothetical protein
MMWFPHVLLSLWLPLPLLLLLLLLGVAANHLVQKGKQNR